MRRHSGSVMLTAAVSMIALALPGLASATASATTDDLVWSSPVLVDGGAGTPLDVACPDVDVCWAIDASGNVLRFDGTSWTDPELVVPLGALTAISCPSAAFCLAVGGTAEGGVSVAWDGRAWGTPVPTPEVFISINCPSRTFCLASDYAGDVYELRRGDWGGATRLGSPHDFVVSISCVSRTFCVAVRLHGGGNIFDGSDWTPVDLISRARLASVSCRSVTFCVAVGSGSPAVYDGTTWSRSKRTDQVALTSVSCPSSTECVAVDIVGGVITYDGKRWSGVTAVVPDHLLASVSCVTTSFCETVGFSLAEGDGSSASFDGAGWSEPVDFDPVVGGISSLSCASTHFCVAADAHGAVTTYDGSAWSEPLRVDPGQRINSISCPTPSFCAAVDRVNQVVTYDGSAWSTPELLEPLSRNVVDVSCSSAHFCVAVDGGGYALTYNGHRWSLPVPVAKHGLRLVSCSSRTLCAATGNVGNAATFDGATWTETTVTNDDFEGISCARSSCTAVTYLGNALDFHEGTWGAPQSIGSDATPWDISCVSGVCRVVTEAGDVITRRDGHWSESLLVDPHGQLKGISCATTRACAAYDTESYVVATF